MKSIAIENPTRLRIGELTFPLFRQDSPDADGETYRLEAFEENEYARDRILHPTQLRKVPGAAIPHGLVISIERPKSHLRRTIHAYFQNLRKGPTVKIVFYFDFDDWHFPMDLVDFAELMKEDLERDKGVIREIRKEISEGSIYLYCEGPIGPEQSCYEAYRAIDDAILKTYRAVWRMFLRETPLRKETSQASELPTDSHGFRWWLRHVLVPIGGPIAVALVLGLVLGGKYLK